MKKLCEHVAREVSWVIVRLMAKGRIIEIMCPILNQASKGKCLFLLVTSKLTYCHLQSHNIDIYSRHAYNLLPQLMCLGGATGLNLMDWSIFCELWARKSFASKIEMQNTWTKSKSYWCCCYLVSLFLSSHHLLWYFCLPPFQGVSSMDDVSPWY